MYCKRKVQICAPFMTMLWTKKKPEKNGDIEQPKFTARYRKERPNMAPVIYIDALVSQNKSEDGLTKRTWGRIDEC